MSEDVDGAPVPDAAGDAAPHAKPIDTGPAGRPAPRCPTDSVDMRFAGGRQVHDLWSERYVCPRCGRETFRSYGRGSV